MENNKKSFLGKMFSGKNDGDVKPAGKKCLPCGAMNPPDAKFCFACGSAFPVKYDSFDAFISYRRETASELASLLKVQLENNFHKRIFIDIKELQEGRFDEALLNRIEETPNFILILSKSSLDKCKEKSDWLKREIIHAIDSKRNIIPVLIKDFTFPSDDKWELLPQKMRILSSLNGINYDHIHQDSDIRRIASYMKTEKEVPTVKLAPDKEEPPPPPPPPPGGRETKPGPIQTGAATPGHTSTGPVGTGPVTTGQTSGVHTPAGQTPSGQTQPVQGPPSGPSVPTDQSNAPYFPVTGVLVKDATGSETILTEFGVRGDAGGPSLENALRDDLTITIGQGTKTIPWGHITSIEIQSRDDATFKLRDGTKIEHVKLAPTRLVGKNQDDFSFSFEFNNKLFITTLRDSSIPGRDELLRLIPILAKRANPQANRWTLTILPEGVGVSVTAENYYYSELKSAHTFRLPGPHKFSANGRFVSFTVSSKAGENFTLGPFPVETAIALAMSLTRLNSLLSENNSPDEKKETTESVNPESLVFLKRGEYLTVGTRDSKIRSYYYGPGTVLQVKEKGKGYMYPYYMFQGADGKDYWLEGPGPVDTVDNRCFFRIAETGQVGYAVGIEGNRYEPWGSLEVFKFEDELLGPTDLRFDHIISMSSQNGTISVKKESGAFSGTLQKLNNYNYGSDPRGPCLVISDSVIPIVRTNREGPLTIIRISESEKPPLVPVSVFGSKTQLKFLLKGNSAVGHFDETITDIYMLLNEQSIGWMRIYIPLISRISFDPESKETPLTVETSEGKTYKGICPDPFSLAGSVFSFANARKPMVLEAMDRKP